MVSEEPTEWEVVMPFGKFKGQRVSEVPTDYLEWFLRDANPTPTLRETIKKALTLRGVEVVTTDFNVALPQNFNVRYALRIVERGRKILEEGAASEEARLSVNVTADWLSEVLGHLMPVE